MVKHGTRLACIQSAWRESVSSGVATFGSPWRPLGKDSVLETAPAQSRAPRERAEVHEATTSAKNQKSRFGLAAAPVCN